MNDDSTTPVTIGLCIIVAACIAATILLLPLEDGERIEPADTAPPTPPSTVWQTTNLPAPLTTEAAVVTAAAARGPAIQVSEPPPAPTTTLPTDPVAIIRWIWPDGPDENYAVLIAWRESGHDPTARNSCCHGLFQIHWTAHRGWLDDFGIYTANDLLDPWRNTRAALDLRQRSGWGPWSTHR